MFNRIRRLLNQFFSKSRTINNEPINKISLIVLIVIDVFILINVFTGLNDISRWHNSPSEAYPCYSEWQTYREQTIKDKDYETIRLSLPYDTITSSNFRKTYQQNQEGRLGEVSETCLEYATYKDKINNSENRQTIKTVDQKQNQISQIEQTNQNIRTQYNSTLLEKIAGQAREQSINAVGAEKAKQELEQNNAKISTLEKEISTLKNGLLTKSESSGFISFLKNDGKFKDVEKGYQNASFWYPSIQLTLQALFLLPLIFVALFVHTIAQRRGYGLLSLMSWHLLVIFLIPLMLKILEFLQVGVIFQFIFTIVGTLFGGLLFLVSYAYILVIPLVGFGIIKFFQRMVFNAKVQAVSRVQKTRCVRCAKNIRNQDTYCPYCGYYQYVECSTCHNPTYKHLPYCNHCGSAQDLSNL